MIRQARRNGADTVRRAGSSLLLTSLLPDCRALISLLLASVGSALGFSVV